MCCHCHQVVQCGLSFKDIIIPLTTIIGIISAAATTYLVIFVKLKKDRQVGWVNDFKKEIINVLHILRRIEESMRTGKVDDFHTQEREKAVDDLQLSLYTLRLNLNTNNTNHAAIIDSINRTMQLVSSSQSSTNRTELDEAIEEVFNLARTIIREENDNMDRLSPFE